VPLNHKDSENSPVSAKAQPSSNFQLIDAAAPSSNLLLRSLLETVPPALPQPANANVNPGAAAESAAEPVTAHALTEAINGLTAAANVASAQPHNEPAASAASSSPSVSVFQAAMAGQHLGAAQQAPNPGSGGHPASQDSSDDESQRNRNDVSANLGSAFPSPSLHDLQRFSSAMLATVAAKPDFSQPASPVVAPSFASSPATSSMSVERSSAGVTPSPDSPATTPHAPTPLLQADGSSNRMVSSAQLLAVSGHSEMRVAMDTDKLGPVELRARMVGDQLGAAILVEKRDAHAALAVELPVLQQALNEKHLRVDQVALLHGSFNSSTPNAGTQAKQDQPSARRSPATAWSANSAVTSIAAGAEHKGIFDTYGRLSVHA
jgi:flagellar hook-length control protein FliK